VNCVSVHLVREAVAQSRSRGYALAEDLMELQMFCRHFTTRRTCCVQRIWWHSWLTFICLLFVFVLSAIETSAEEKSDSCAARTSREKDGSLVICGGGNLPMKIFGRFLELAGKHEAHVVVIPTANIRADAPNAEGLFLAGWRKAKLASLVMLHTRDREQANKPEFVAPLKRATAVWFNGGVQSRIAKAYVGTAVERELHALLKRGGVIGGTSAGAAVQSRLMIAGGNPVAVIGKGFDLLPGAVIDQHFLRLKRKPRLVGVVQKHPHLIGFGIDEQTALIVEGRRMEVVGNSTVTVCTWDVDTQQVKESTLKPGEIADQDTFRRRVDQIPAKEAGPSAAGRHRLPSPGGEPAILGMRDSTSGSCEPPGSRASGSLVGNLPKAP